MSNSRNYAGGGISGILSNIAFYSILSVIIFLLLLAIYSYFYKSNKSKMSLLYNLGSLLSDKNAVTKFLRNSVERYLELILTIPGFNFNTPVYFNALGQIVPIDSTLIPTIKKPVVTPSTALNPSTTSPTKPTEPEMESSNINDINKEIRDTMNSDPAFSSSNLKNLGIAIAIQIAASKIISSGAKYLGKVLMKTGFKNSIVKMSVFLGKKITFKAMAKMLSKTVSMPIKFAAKGVLAVIAKFGTRMGFKTGLITSMSIASKALRNSASKAVARLAATSGGKVATKAAAAASKAAAKAGMGPVGWALLAFDVLSMGLDLGDAGGYMLLDQYKIVRDAVNKELSDAFKAVDIVYPYPVGPLDKYKEVAEKDYADHQYNAKYSIIKDDAYYADSIKDILEETYESEKDKIDDIMLKLSDADRLKLDGESVKNMCETLKGTVYENLCFYDDYFEKAKEAKMAKSLDPDSKYMKPFMEAYTQWINNNPEATEDQTTDKFSEMMESMVDFVAIEKQTLDEWCVEEGGKVLSNGTCTYTTPESCNAHYKMIDGKPEPIFTNWDSDNSRCVVNDWTIKKMCEENKLLYNTNTGLCEVTENLCLSKGAEWDAAKKDCRIPQEQEVIEFIFGTTVTRGLKQVFDPAQYEQCPSGTTDHGYVCNKNSVNHYPCTDFGNEWYDEGLRCSNIAKYKTADCPAGYVNMGATCEPRSYGRGVGVLGSSVKNYGCKDGWNHRGAYGAGWCDKSHGWLGLGLWTEGETDWFKPQSEIPYSLSAGNNIPDPGEGNRKWEKSGLLFYPECPAGTSNVGDLICRTDGPTQWNTDKMTCPAGWFKEGGLCYQQANVNGTYENVKTKDYSCPEGTQPWMGNCRTVCPPGYRNDGLGCWKKRKVDYSTKDNFFGGNKGMSMLGNK